MSTSNTAVARSTCPASKAALTITVTASASASSAPSWAGAHKGQDVVLGGLAVNPLELGGAGARPGRGEPRHREQGPFVGWAGQRVAAALGEEDSGSGHQVLDGSRDQDLCGLRQRRDL